MYVAGNHEYYESSLAATGGELSGLAHGTSVHFLARSEVVIAGVRFLGATLWTDYELFEDPDRRRSAMAAAREYLLDFRLIRMADEDARLFTPEDAATVFRDHAQWLAARLGVPHAGPTVVVTHHAPSPRSIHPRFADSPINIAFVSRAEHLLDGRRAALWVHGHTHDSFDYVVNGTRVVCNPRGYARDGVNENRAFDPRLVIELG